MFTVKNYRKVLFWVTSLKKKPSTQLVDELGEYVAEPSLSIPGSGRLPARSNSFQVSRNLFLMPYLVFPPQKPINELS